MGTGGWVARPSVDGLDAGEPQLLDVDPGLHPARDGVVDGALAAQPEEHLALAVEQGKTEPAVLLVAGERRGVGDGHQLGHRQNVGTRVAHRLAWPTACGRGATRLVAGL